MENTDILQEKINNASEKLEKVKKEVHKKIVGQDALIESLIIGLLAKGHILIEWVPGLAKTLSIDTLSKTLGLWFSRVQFTPDLLPSDLIGAEIYNPKSWEFSIKYWPIFNNFILADEINRAPSKVQSALLEAMAEKQITIWNESFKLDEPFIVLATQNPIEQSGTYRLPEAQIDRFMMKVWVDYNDKNTEIEMYKKVTQNFEDIKINKVLNKKEILEIQKLVKEIYVSDNIFEYVWDIIDSTRNNISKYLEYWISPRWWIALINGAKVVALLNKRTFVIPEDIKKIARVVLSHRLSLNYNAVSDWITWEKIVEEILNNVKVV